MNFTATFAEPNAAIQAAFTDAIPLSNSAVAAMKAGRFTESMSLHQQAYDIKLRAYGPDSFHVAISSNGLGEAAMRAGELQKADEMLSHALRVRGDKLYGGLEQGSRVDAAVTRENMAALREVQGRFDEAKKLRLQGEGKGEIVCANYKCPGAMYKRTDLKVCAGCHSIFYHARECQKVDWTSRHKPLCQSRTARGASQ